MCRYDWHGIDDDPLAIHDTTATLCVWAAVSFSLKTCKSVKAQLAAGKCVSAKVVCDPHSSHS